MVSLHSFVILMWYPETCAPWQTLKRAFPGYDASFLTTFHLELKQTNKQKPTALFHDGKNIYQQLLNTRAMWNVTNGTTLSSGCL